MIIGFGCWFGRMCFEVGVNKYWLLWMKILMISCNEVSGIGNLFMCKGIRCKICRVFLCKGYFCLSFLKSG